jgi:hypothetical protein
MMTKLSFSKSSNKSMKEIVDTDLHTYSCEGLRTLVMGMRSVPEKEFNTFNDLY